MNNFVISLLQIVHIKNILNTYHLMVFASIIQNSGYCYLQTYNKLLAIHIYMDMCKIKMPLGIGCLFKHANYLGSKSDYRTLQLVHFIPIATAIK